MSARLPLTADVLALLMAADAGLVRLKETLAQAGFTLMKTTGRPTKRGVTVRAVWRKRQEGVTAEFNGTFRYDAADFNHAEIKAMSGSPQ